MRQQFFELSDRVIPQCGWAHRGTRRTDQLTPFARHDEAAKYSRILPPRSLPKNIQFAAVRLVWKQLVELAEREPGAAADRVVGDGSGNQYMFFADNGFNPNGTTIAQIQGYGPAVPWNSMTFNNDQFAYDSVNRLFSVTDTVYGGGPTNYTRTYSYDEYGNRSISGYTNLAPSGFTPTDNGTHPYQYGEHPSERSQLWLT